MGYIDTLDIKASINAARKEMEQFSDLYKLHNTSAYYNSIQGHSYDSVISIINYLSYDEKNLNQIDKIDRQKDSIKKTLQAISKLDEREMEYIFNKYILSHTNSQIETILNISSRTRSRLSNNALFSMSLLLGIEVEKEEKRYD